MDENNGTTVSTNAQTESQATSTEAANATSNKVETTDQTTQNESQNDSAQLDIEKLIQKAVDRATNKLGNENKKLRTQLDTLKKEKMTEDEIKQLEMADKEADLADREAKLTEKENRWIAINAIKDAGLDDGGKNALELVEFVMSDDEETTKARVKVFSELVKKFVAAQVDQTFRSRGRNPEQSGSGESTNINHTVIKSIGDMAAERNKTASDVLKHYLGGN